MQGPIRCAAVAGLLLGCHPGGVDTPVDSQLGPSGLRVVWSSTPETWPGDLGPGIQLEQARFALNSLRVVGDAGPGDPRTTIGNMEMGFAWDSGEQRPTDITFDDAPTGLYSQIAIVLDRTNSGGNNNSYELRGHVQIGSETVEYRIQDDRPLTFNVDVDETVSPGESAVIVLRINFQRAIASIDFSRLDIDDDRVELEDGDPQMATFRTKLVESFEVVGP